MQQLIKLNIMSIVEGIMDYKFLKPKLKTCYKHTDVGYKKRCKDCFDENKKEDRDGSWHTSQERDNFGDRD